MNRPDLDLVTSDVEALEKLTAAKEAYRGKPTPANRDKLNAAKTAVQELRAYWRGIREYTNPTAAIPAATTKVKGS